jgi:multisubunit Na+/H+ antiporter MnhB subunit
MNTTGLAVAGIGIGLLLIAFSMRKQGAKPNYKAFILGGVTMLLLAILSAVFGFKI